MKKALLFLFIGLLLAGCSNDDSTFVNEMEPVQLKIKSYTSNYLTNENIITYYFNEDGNITKRTYQRPNFSELSQDYNYNEIGNVIEKRALLVGGNTRSYKYYYNAENKIERFDYFSDGALGYTYTFTYIANTLQINWASPGSSKSINYDADGKIEHTNFQYDLGNYVDENIRYDSKNNILEINAISRSGHYNNYKYEYDSIENPLYNQFHKNYFSYAFAEGLYLNNESLFFSPYLISKYIYKKSSNTDDNYEDIITYQYNEEGYPISSERSRDNAIILTSTYEYY